VRYFPLKFIRSPSFPDSRKKFRKKWDNIGANNNEFSHIKIDFFGIYGNRNSFGPVKSRGRISSPGACGQLPVFAITFMLNLFSFIRSL
jgi:hypothetical protein